MCDTETYTKDQFVKLCVSMGYIPKKEIAIKYCDIVMKTIFTAIDLEEASRWFEHDSRVGRGDSFTKSIQERSNDQSFNTISKAIRRR